MNLAGNVDFDRYDQTGANASMAADSVTFISRGDIDIRGGAATLDNIAVTAPHTEVRDGATLSSSGTITGTLENYNGNVLLDGNLTVSSSIYQQFGTIRLRGFTLTGQGPAVRIDQGGGDIYLDGGTLVSTGSIGIRIETGNIRGVGTLTASSVVLLGTASILVGDGNPAGTLTINGALRLGAATTVVITVGGTAAAPVYAQLAVSGQATLAGTLGVLTVNNFVPDPLQTPVLQVLTFGSRMGAFANDTINLGNGFGFDVTYQTFGVELVSRSF